MNPDQASHSPSPGPAHIDESGVCQTIGGYRSLFAGRMDESPDTTSDEYATAQALLNAEKATAYLLPMAQAKGARSVLDVGCGVGTMVQAFIAKGFDAYGVDLPGLHRHWSRQGLPADRMFIVDPARLRLPFADGGVDFLFTLGVIEHVGTSDGHADRLPNHHELRQQWLRELYRVVRPGGAMLIGGPNRRFPVDMAHGLDSRASGLERWLSAKMKTSVHRTWGDNFLWAYEDIDRYLQGLTYRMEPQSITGFLSCSRVPGPVRPLVQAYLNHLPRPLRGTGFNPWVMALVNKPALA
jgi:SAM-dependent methyltransferase